MRSRIALLVLVLVVGTVAGQERLPDFTKVEPRELGVELVQPQKDPKTGFVVGGTNSTELILKLTEMAGRPIAALERDMRPGNQSTLGFLGKDERLLDILAADNRFVVEEQKRTHQELARHLHVVGAIGLKHGLKEPYDFTYHGRQFRVKAVLFRGVVESPFRDDTRTNAEATVKNLDTGKELKYSLLVPHLVERYGFYEGKGTPYRVDPRAILEVFDFLKPAAKP